MAVLVNVSITTHVASDTGVESDMGVGELLREEGSFRLVVGIETFPVKTMLFLLSSIISSISSLILESQDIIIELKKQHNNRVLSCLIWCCFKNKYFFMFVLDNLLL